MQTFSVIQILTVTNPDAKVSKVMHPDVKKKKKKKKKKFSFKETQKAFKTCWTQSKQRAISYSDQVVNQNKRIKVDKPVKQTNHHQQTKQINQLKQVNPDYHSSSKLLQF